MLKKNLIHVGLVQQKGHASKKVALQQTIQGIREAHSKGAELILLQELHTSLYFCQNEEAHLFDLAEPIPGPSSQQLSDCAKELNIVLVASLFEKRAPGLYHNTAVVFEKNGSIAGKYRKMHIPDDPGYYEKFYFTPGDLGFQPIQTSLGKLGVLVCWDQWYPEAARLMALAGADILLYPTAIGGIPEDAPEEQTKQRDAWITVQRAHAIANGLPVITCNRVGLEKNTLNDNAGIQFWGSSFICGPQGEMLSQANQHDETILVSTLDLTQSEKVRRLWPFLRDRRIDEYQDLLKRYRD